MDTLKNKEYKLQAMTNTFRDGAPYKGINSTYLSPDGELFEMQFHTPESFDMKKNSIIFYMSSNGFLTDQIRSMISCNFR